MGLEDDVNKLLAERNEAQLLAQRNASENGTSLDKMWRLFQERAAEAAGMLSGRRVPPDTRVFLEAEVHHFRGKYPQVGACKLLGDAWCLGWKGGPTVAVPAHHTAQRGTKMHIGNGVEVRRSVLDWNEDLRTETIGLVVFPNGTATIVGSLTTENMRNHPYHMLLDDPNGRTVCCTVTNGQRPQCVTSNEQHGLTVCGSWSHDWVHHDLDQWLRDGLVERFSGR